MNQANVAPNPAGGNTPRQSRYLKWRRRLKRILIALVIAAFAFRMLLSLLLPYAINKAAGLYGLDCQYSRLKLSLLGGFASIWDMKLTPKSGGEPILVAYNAGGAISTWDLLHGQLTIWRINADAVDVYVERLADGRIPLIERFVQTTRETKPLRQATAAARGEMNFSSPLQAESISLDRLRVHLRDATVQPEFKSTIEVGVRVDNLGSTQRAAQFELTVRSKDLLDELRLTGQGLSWGSHLDATLNIKGWGLNPSRLAAYLKPMGLRPLAERVDVSAQMALRTWPNYHSADGLQVHCELSDLSMNADGVSAASVSKIVVDSPWLSPTRLDIGKIAISGVRMIAGRAADGRLRAGGLELLAAAASAATPPMPATRPATVAAAPEIPAAPDLSHLPLLSLDSLVISDVKASFTDQAVPGSAHFELALDEMQLRNLANYPRHPDKPASFSLAFGLPGIAQRVQLEADVQPFAAEKNGRMMLEVSGIKLDTLQAYLRPLGVESDFQNGVLHAEVKGGFVAQADGSIKGDIQLKDLSLVDTRELFRWDGLAIKGCSIDPRTLEIHLDAIDLVGPSLNGERDASGSIRMLGFHTRQPEAPATVPVSTTEEANAQPAPAASAAQGLLPVSRIVIDRFTWKNLQLHLRDAAVTPATTLDIQDAGVEITSLDLATRPTTRPVTPAGLKAWLRAPGLINRLDATGSLTVEMNAVKLDISADSDGITGAPLNPYLQPLGAEAIVKNGKLKLAAHLAVARTAAGAQAEVALRDYSFSDAGHEFSGLDLFAVGPVQITPRSIDVAAVQLKRPRVNLSRDADGRLEVGGMRLVARPEVPAKPAPSAPAAVAPKASTPPVVITVGALLVDDAQLGWADQAVKPAVDLLMHSSVDVKGLTFGKDAQPATLAVTNWVDGVLQKMTVDGTIRTGTTHQSADLAIRGYGQRIGPLASYLPPTLRCTLQDGRLFADVSADITPAPAGGVMLQVAAKGLKLAEKEQVLAQVGEASLRASRIDPAKGLIALDAITLSGVQMEAHRTTDNQIALAGISTCKSTSAATPAPTPDHAMPLQATPAAEADVATLVNRARASMPLVTLQTLDLRVDQFRLVDDQHPAAPPVIVRDIRFANRAPLAWLGPDPMKQAPNELQFTLQVDDLVDRWTTNILLAPFAAEPYARIDTVVTGIHGARLAQYFPAISGTVDGSTLKNATFKVELELAMKVERRGPVQFDFRRDFEVYTTFRNIEFRDQQGPVLAGVQEINIPAAKVKPGDGGVIIPSVEITKPIFHAWREKDGLHVMGLRIPLPAATTQAAAPTAAAPAQSPAPAPAPTAAVATTSPVEGEVVIRKLTISGIDVSYEDRSVTPAFQLPLTGLEVEVFDISSLMTSQKRPLRFNSTLTAGKVSLPTRAHHETGNTDRPVFAQIATNGQLSLYPQPTGWVKNSINGFELVALKGIAREQGVTLTRGMLDVDTDIRLRSAQDADINTRTTLTDLSISEEDNGPIQRLLKLPAPLTIAINLIEDADGSIVLPLSIAIRNQGLSKSALVGSVLGATGQVIATAIASSPLKLINAATGGAAKKPSRETTVEIAFAPGTGSLESDDIAKITKALERYRADRNAEISITHVLGKGDVDMATQRANPGQNDAMALVTQLRDRRNSLLERRRDVESRARSELGMARTDAARPTLDELRFLNRQISQTEDSLDRVLDLFRAGADRQADRRTRAAALAISEQRLQAVQTAIANAHVGSLASRISKVNPRFTTEDLPATGEVVVKISSRSR